jgi:hypothetical protein
MASMTDRQVQALFDRADEAVRRSRVIRAGIVARKEVHLRTASDHAERRLVAEHEAAVLRAVPPLD